MALRPLGLRVASFSPPPTLPRFPALSPSGPPPLLSKGANSWKGWWWTFPGSPSASVSDSALGRACTMWQIQGNGAVTATVKLVAEAGIYWILYLLPYPPRFPTLPSVAIVVRRPCRSQAARICVLEGGSAWQSVGQGLVVFRPTPALPHRYPGHFSLFGSCKLLRKTDHLQRTQPVTILEGFRLLLLSTCRAYASPKPPPRNKISKYKPCSCYENVVSRQNFQASLFLCRNSTSLQSFPRSERASSSTCLQRLTSGGGGADHSPEC